MKKEETLQRIKSVEADVRRSKDEALAEKERILRAARREALELRESLRAQAEKRGEELLRDAEVAIGREKELILADGRKQAAAMKALGEANLDRAVDRLIEKFQGAIHA